MGKVVRYPFSAVGAPWDSLTVPINNLHPRYIISVIVRRSLRVDADDEREKLVLETIGIGNSTLLLRLSWRYLPPSRQVSVTMRAHISRNM